MGKVGTSLLALMLVTARAEASGDGGVTETGQPPQAPEEALLAECSHGEQNDRCSFLEMVVTNNLLDDLETLYWARDVRALPVAVEALTIEDPRIQLAAMRVLEQLPHSASIETALEPLLYAPTMVLPSAAAALLRRGEDGVLPYLGSLYPRGHGDEAWTNDDNLFTTIKADPVSGGFTLFEGLTALPPADYFDRLFTSAGFTTAATPEVVAAFYATALGGTPVDYWTWAIAFISSCLAGDGTTAGRCAFDPVVEQLSLDENEKGQWVIEAAGATPAKLVLIHPDRTLGKTMVRLAWRTPTPLPLETGYPEDQPDMGTHDGGVAIDAPLFGGTPPTQGNVPQATKKKSSGCQIAGSSSGAHLPALFCLGVLFLRRIRRMKKGD